MQASNFFIKFRFLFPHCDKYSGLFTDGQLFLDLPHKYVECQLILLLKYGILIPIVTTVIYYLNKWEQMERTENKIFFLC